MAIVMQQYNTTPIRMRCARIHRKCYFPTSVNSFHIISWYRQLATTTCEFHLQQLKRRKKCGNYRNSR